MRQYTLGEGLKNAKGMTLAIPDLFDFLVKDQGMGRERWIALHHYVGGHRLADNWLGAWGVPVDLDFRAVGPDGKREKVSSDGWGDELDAAWEAGTLAGSVYWRTPHGVRMIYLLAEECRDADLYGRMCEAAARAAADVVRKIVTVEVEVDEGMKQVTRLLYLPRTVDGKGLRRTCKVLGHLDEAGAEVVVFTAEAILAMAPPATQPLDVVLPGVERRVTAESVSELAEARQKFNQDIGSEKLRIPGLGADFETDNRWCPVCQHDECFGPAKQGNTIMRGRWVCYSTSHFKDTPYADRGAKVGARASGGTATGDTLDLACWFAGIGQAEFLIHRGYLRPGELPLPKSAGDKPQVKVPHDGTNNYTSTLDFAAAVFEAAPAGTVYRYGGQLCVLLRNEGRVGVRAMTPVGMSLLASRWASYFTDKVVGGLLQHPQVNLDGKHGQVLLEAGLVDTRIRDLQGITTHPALGPGEVMLRPGWNPECGLWYEAPHEFEALQPATSMSREEAGAWLRGFLEDFSPVLDAEALANAVGLIVTAFVRPALTGHPVPIHAAISSMEGSGKSVLCESFVGEAVTGKTTANIHLFRDGDELAKTLFAYAQSGISCIVIDNVRGGSTLDDPMLASAITRPTFAARVLGQSQMREQTNLFVPMMTGNNVSFSPEIARRTVPIQFRPKVTLQQRRFKHEARRWVRDNRRRLAEVVFGAVERWAATGKAGFPGRYMMGFDEWSRIVGGIVYQLGQDAWLENLAGWQQSDEVNPYLTSMRSFCAAWWKARSNTPVRVADIWHLVEDDPTTLGLTGNTEQARKVSLGKKLGEMCGRVDLSPYSVHLHGSSSGQKHWRLERTREPGEEG